MECAGRAPATTALWIQPWLRGRGQGKGGGSTVGAIQSGVALRFPPHSKTLRELRITTRQRRRIHRNFPGYRLADHGQGTSNASTFWSAPAERQRRRRFGFSLGCGDAGEEMVAGRRLVPSDPKRRGASLPAALQNASRSSGAGLASPPGFGVLAAFAQRIWTPS